MSAFACLFDWDGVIVDSSSYHERSWEMLAASEGKTLDADHFLKGFGRKNEWIFANLLKWTEDKKEISRLSLKKEEFYRSLISSGGIAPMQGVEVFLNRLQNAGISMAVGSSTPRANIDFIIDRIGLKKYFVNIISSEDVTAGKPDPEVFLKAAALTGVRAEKCVVFEDAVFGLQAARAACMKAVAVTSTHSRELLTPWADRIVAKLDEISIKQLEKLFC